jgi:8-oxo-dGTP pyrophosphatase MutT (NUDIX family)
MFKGAGIMFYKKSNEGQFISLGKRTCRPHRGYWSTPGGKLDKKDNNDFFQCALRETHEEYFFNLNHEFEKIYHLPVIKSCRIYIPFIFEYYTYLMDVSEVQIQFSHNCEFESIDWFGINKLPPKTHTGVFYAMWFFELRMKLF